MEDYRRFEKIDWDAFAGAECFSDGSQPFIYVSHTLNEGLVELCVLADKTGIEIYLVGEEDNVWSKDLPLTSLRAEGELRELIKVLKEYTYAPDLSYELDHPTHEATKGFTFC